MLVSATEPPELRALGTYSGACEAFGVDFLWTAHKKMWGVQRKEIRDLVASATDGRLGKEVAQMSKLGVAILMVEGRPMWTRDGYLADQWITWSKDAYLGLLMSVQSKGIWVFTSDDILDSIRVLTDLERWSKKDEHLSLVTRPKPTAPWGNRSNRDYASYVLQSIEGVGPKMANKILDKFGRLPLKWSVPIDEMKDIEGIGPGKLAKIYAVFEPFEGGTDAEPKKPSGRAKTAGQAASKAARTKKTRRKTWRGV